MRRSLRAKAVNYSDRNEQAKGKAMNKEGGKPTYIFNHPAGIILSCLRNGVPLPINKLSV